MLSIITQLEARKEQDNFPLEGWEARGLNPSPEDIRKGMNLAISEFVDFLIAQLTASLSKEDLQERVQEYFDEMDIYDFDTEEREWIVDVQCALAHLAGVDCDNLVV